VVLQGLLLALLCLYALEPASGTGPTFSAMLDGVGSLGKPNVAQRNPTSYTNFSSSASKITSKDNVFYGTSAASASGQYDCQIYQCNLGLSCATLASLNFTWFGYEQIAISGVRSV